MTSRDIRSDSARRYVGDLDVALIEVDAPPSLRAELIDDVSSELADLDEREAATRIAELGDPHAIAADARREAGSGDAATPTAAAVSTPVAAPSKAYPIATYIVLVVGWFVLPVVGWVAGLVMVGLGAGWATAVKRRAIVGSIASVVVGVVALVALRGSDAGLLGLALFVLAPLIGNIVVGVYLNQRWGVVRP